MCVILICVNVRLTCVSVSLTCVSVSLVCECVTLTRLPSCPWHKSLPRNRTRADSAWLCHLPGRDQTPRWQEDIDDAVTYSVAFMKAEPETCLQSVIHLVLGESQNQAKIWQLVER